MRATKNRVGRKSRKKRLTLNRGTRWEGKREKSGIAWKWKETLIVIKNYIKEVVRGIGRKIRREMNYSRWDRKRRWGEGDSRG